MPFQPKTWIDRNAEFPNRRQLLPVTAGDFSLVDVELAEGQVFSQGYDWNANNMNDLENRIATYLNTTLRVQFGTFVPSVNNNSGLTRVGTYYRIGNLCHVTIQVSGTMQSITSQIQVTNLPFPAFSGDEQHIESGFNEGFNANGREFGIIAPNSTVVRMYVDTQGMTHPNAGFVVLRLCGVYRVS